MLIREKIAQAKQILQEFAIDCWITFTRETQITGDPTLPFLVSSDLTWHSALIVTRLRGTHAIVGEYDRLSVAETGAYDEVVGYVEGMRKPLIEYLRSLAPRTIALNFSKESEISDGLTHGMYLTLLEILQEAGLAERVISAEKIISALRQRKTDSEIARIKTAIDLTLKIFHEVTPFLRPGRTEKEVAAFMRGKVEEAGADFAWDPGSCPAVFSGPETAGAHYAPTDRRIEPGHVLNMDFGVKIDGYCSDLQRTFYLLRPDERRAPADVQQGFDTIVRAIESSRLALRPGVQGITVDQVARETLAAAGYEGFPHGLGHQVGRFAHDGTALLAPAWEKYGNKPFERVEKGMVFTLEPRLTVKGSGVATIEEMVLVTEHGAEFLSTPQTEIITV
jgi:Xaa-Pro aminopeptidase